MGSAFDDLAADMNAEIDAEFGELATCAPVDGSPSYRATIVYHNPSERYAMNPAKLLQIADVNPDIDASLSYCTTPPAEGDVWTRDADLTRPLRVVSTPEPRSGGLVRLRVVRVIG